MVKYLPYVPKRINILTWPNYGLQQSRKVLSHKTRDLSIQSSLCGFLVDLHCDLVSIYPNSYWQEKDPMLQKTNVFILEIEPELARTLLTAGLRPSSSLLLLFHTGSDLENMFLKCLLSEYGGLISAGHQVPTKLLYCFPSQLYRGEKT